MKTCELRLPVSISEEAANVKDSAEKVKQALKEAQRAQTAASSAIQQATTNIQNTNNLLSSVSLTHPLTSCQNHHGQFHQNMVVTCLLVLHSGGVRDGRR